MKNSSTCCADCLAAASESETDRNSFLVREYIAVGMTLSAGEMRVLSAYYHYLPEWRTISGQAGHLTGITGVLNLLQEKTGIKQHALLESFDKSLTTKNLTSAGSQIVGSTTVSQILFRLTDFGFAFCEFLQSHEKLK